MTKEPKLPKSLPYPAFLVLIALVIFFSALIIRRIVAIPDIRHQLILATTRQPETFTELFFENPLALPQKITHGKKYQFSFTIHNLESKDMTYPYVVYLSRDGVKTIIDQKTLTLHHDESKTISESIGPLKVIRKQIIVELTTNHQIISFWMDKI